MLFTLRSGGTAHPEDSVLQHITDQFVSSGVFDLAGNDFKIQAQAVPDMTVKSVMGRAYIKGTLTPVYPIRADADASVTISPNSSGNPRIDAVVLYINRSATPNADASNVATLAAVQGTPAAAPSAPTDSEISTAIGATNPFIRLANVAVASGATSITNPNITDTRVVCVFKVGKVEMTDGRISLLEQVTPVTPASGKMLIYPKSDNKLYKKDDMGVESEVGAGAAEFSPNLLDNGNFINNSSNGYGNIPDDWINFAANPNQGGFPSFTKQQLIDLLGITDGDIEGLWNLNGNFTDLSNNGYNLTAVNGPTDSNDSLMAQAKNFVVASSQHATNPAANTRIAGNQTMFCLFKATALGTTQRIMGLSDPTLTDFCGIQLSTDGHIEFAVSQLAGSGFPMTQRTEAGKWYFVVVVYNASTNTIIVSCNGLSRISGTSGVHNAGTSGFSIGRWGDNNSGYFGGLVQGAGVLSVALSDTQIKKLWAFLTYRGVKIRRSGVDGFIEQNLTQDQIERLRGKTITVAGLFNQDTASIASIAIDDGVTETQTTPNATINSFQEVSHTKVISAIASKISVKLKVYTTNGNVWFKEVRLNESDSLVKYAHSPRDWARFPSLLRYLPPRDGQGVYHFEEGRDYPFTVTASDFTLPAGITFTSLSDYGSSYRWLSRKLLQWKPRFLFQGWGSVPANASGINLKQWIGIPEETSLNFYGGVFFYGAPGPGPGSFHTGGCAVGDSFVAALFKSDGTNLAANGGFLYGAVNAIYTVRDDI